MKLQQLNELPEAEAVKAFMRCCGSTRWAEAMAQNRPFGSRDELFDRAESLWWEFVTLDDWLEACSHHPRIGDIDSLREKFATTRDWAEGEQQGTAEASEETLKRLAAANDAYEANFGYIFIVCATGKSAEEMLAILEDRLGNDPDEELRIAAGEQHKITCIRLEKLLS